ncbi:hypothetical protein GWE18_00270 [Bradyrhizobium sp. CSA112]|uniref:hypothetical protein n=1 Tax=Bradyrhizobium sp. CSA112 TaxID=2699170 RepID=UPI0023B06850|nr:hypothetical protein [Bradyrhizobium sp. CSA112]MDE5451311.1 hypothetical protein [Bradyrhizobium sp. CSA112]
MAKAGIKPLDDRPLSDPKSWARTHGTYISGRAYIDGADETAAEMETKWGCDRLRLLVGPELREKFDRQRYLFNQAIWHGDLEDVRRESGRMVNAWMALDRAATEAGKQLLAPTVWEIPLEDGTVAAIVPDDAQAHAVVGEGRKVSVFTLEEIGRLLSNYPDIAKAKLVFPGATITAVRRSVEDPLKAIHDTDEPLDDPIGF